MKYLKFILILTILIMPKCFANESPEFIKELRGHLEYNEEINDDYNPNYIYLEPETKNFINISQPQSISSKSMNLKKDNFSVFNSGLKNSSAFARQEYAIKTQSGELAENYGNFTFGTKYYSAIYDGEMTYTTGIYTRIDGKHTALTITANTETGNSYSNYSDYLIIAPEWKISKQLSLLNTIKTDIRQLSQKSEIVLRYKPKIKRYNDLFLELGVSQTYREQEYVKSSIRFSTGFKL